MLLLVLSGLVLTFSINNSVCLLFLVLSIIFSLLPLSSLFSSDVELVNMADLPIQLFSYLFYPWHMWGSFLSLSPRYLPKTRQNFSISGISFSCASSPFSVLKNFFWCHWNMILSCFLLRFSSHSASFIFLYLSLCNHCSLAFLRL